MKIENRGREGMSNGAEIVTCEICKCEAVLHAHVIKDGKTKTACYYCLADFKKEEDKANVKV